MPIDGAKTSTPVSSMKVSEVSRTHAAPRRQAVIIFNTGDGLDLAFNGTYGVRFLDDLGCLSLVLGYRHFGRVEQHRIPPVLQAFGDDVSVRAVIEVKGDRNLDAGGHRPPHAGEHLDPDTADSLDRGLHNHR